MSYHLPNQRINYFNYFFRQPFQSESSPYYFAYGRTALKYGLIANNFHIGRKKVLMPAFICKEAIKPFLDLNIKLVYYSIKEDFSPDWTELTKIMSEDVNAIMMVHYFGLAQDIERFIKFSTENNLFLIEDNSHGYGGLTNGKLLGEFGGLGISAPRKSLPLNNGALLYLRNGFYKPELKSLEPMNITKLIVKDSISRCLDFFLPLKKFIQDKRKPFDFDSYLIEDWLTDKSNYEYLSKINLENLRIKRSEIYRVWYNWSVKSKFHPIELKHNNYAPMLFPLIVNSREVRDDLFQFLKKRNIPVYILWNEQPPINSSAKSIKDKLLCLPINLNFSPSGLEAYLTMHCQYNN